LSHGPKMLSGKSSAEVWSDRDAKLLPFRGKKSKEGHAIFGSKQIGDQAGTHGHKSSQRVYPSASAPNICQRHSYRIE